MVCDEKNSTVMVDLRQRECMVCRPSFEERVQVVDVCDDVTTQDCQDDPLKPEPWTKFCDTYISNIPNNGLTFKFEKSLAETLADDLVKQSLDPINDLLADTLPSRPQDEDNSTEVTTPAVITLSTAKPRSITQRTEAEDVSEILKILSQKQIEPTASEDFFFGETATSTTASRPVTAADWHSLSSSVYFDPVLNTRPLSPHYQDTTQSSLTELLNFQLQKPFSTTTSNERRIDFESQGSKKIDPSLLITTTEIGKEFNTKPRIFVTEIQTTKTTETTTSSTAQTTTTMNPNRKETVTKESHTRATLSPSEVLQLCFLNSSYCDFSQNEVVVSFIETTTKLTTTPSTTTETLDITVTKESSLLVAQQEDIKDQIRKCFLTGECGDSGHPRDSDDQRNSPAVVTTTQSLIRQRSSSRDSELRRQVQKRARACLFEGKCN